MTLKERVIVETYTGICMVTGDERDEVNKYMEELMGRPVFTHELADEKIQEELKQRALPDFKALCITEKQWDEAKKNVWELLPFYIECGAAGGFFGAKYLRDLIERYNSGERTAELYEAMIEAE